MSRFGELLRWHRLAAGLTQRDLARRAGLSLNAVSMLERGERQRPYFHTMTVLADALGLEAASRQEFVAAAGEQGPPPADSIDQLEAGDRTLLCRASVFANSFSAPAAQRVCADGEADASMLPRLAALTAAGFLDAVGSDWQMRFSMPAPVRELASIRLAESGEADRIQRRHTMWCLELASAAEGAADRGDIAELALCSAEVDDLCSAITRSLTLVNGDEVALPLSATVGLLLGLHDGELSAAMTWLRRALALEARAETMPSRALMLARAGQVAFRLRDFRTAVVAGTQAVRIQREAGPRWRLPATLDSLGHAHWAHTNPAAGLPLFREAIDLARAGGDQFALTRGLRSAAAAVWRLAGPRAATGLFRESLDVARRVGDPLHEVLALSGLGCTMAEMGDCVGGRGLLLESVEKARTLDVPSITARTLVRLGFVDLLGASRPELARDRFVEALSIGRDAAPMWRRHAMAGLAIVALRLGNELEAARVMTEIGEVDAGSMEWDPHVRLALAPWAERLNKLLNP